MKVDLAVGVMIIVLSKDRQMEIFHSPRALLHVVRWFPSER
jgi:hypothetical protein